MRKKISLFALYGVLLWGAFANYTLISHPEKRLTAYYRTHAEEGYYSVNDKETDVPATMMKLTGINIAVVLLGATAFMAGGFLSSPRTVPPIVLKEKSPDVPAEDYEIGNSLDHYFEGDEGISSPPKKQVRPRAKPAKTKIDRLTFLSCMIVWLILSITWFSLFNYVEASDSDFKFRQNMEALLVVLPSCITCLFIFAFRFRSMGYSGWMALWTLLPITSAFMLLACLLIPPSAKPERVGDLLKRLFRLPV